MPAFVLDRRPLPNGDYAVHNTSSDCRHLPLTENQIALGNHLTVGKALRAAMKMAPDKRIDGCLHCCQLTSEP